MSSDKPERTALSEVELLKGGGSTPREHLRLLKIIAEFEIGFRRLQKVSKAVTIFGSARMNEGHQYYAPCMELSEKLSNHGFSIITGGGPGLMEAANRGAQKGSSKSIGLNIELPHEQSINPYCDDGIEFKYFFSRKVMLVRYSQALVVFPGGFGTLDELFETLNLIITGKMLDYPVILFGESYWRGLLDWLQQSPLSEGAINQKDLDKLTLSNDINQSVQIIRDSWNRSHPE